MLMDTFAAVLVYEFSRKTVKLICCQIASSEYRVLFFKCKSLIPATRSKADVFCKFKLQ